MKTGLVCAAVVAGLTLTTTMLRASTVAGIFAIIDDVVLEPDDGAPERIRIAGLFVVPVAVSSGQHQSPQRGRVCFSLPKGLEDSTRKDWAAIATVAGTGRVVAFGQYWVVTARYDNGGTANTSLVVHVQKEGSNGRCEPYPVPNPRGVLTTFDTLEDASPRFGEPSQAIVSRLQEAYKH